MLRARIIPCLLIHKGGLVKTYRFKDPKYVGDPLNAVKIFNEKEADELIILDIDATVENREPNFSLIEKLATECSMPLCYGGGITTSNQVSKLVNMGVEKVAISNVAVNNTQILTKMVDAVGRQSVVVVLDIKKKKGLFSNEYEVCTHNASRIINKDPLKLLNEIQDAGVGEIVINFVDDDGVMQGYNFNYAKSLSNFCSTPITFLGGAGSLDHIEQLISELGIVGAAAGSLFVFKGKYRAVLINYPTPEEKFLLCQNALSNYKSEVYYVKK